jgi:hypothetical protein
MPRKQLDLPKWSGELAKPIDIPGGWSLDKEGVDKGMVELLGARLEKLQLLAKALGVPSLEKTSDPVVFYAAIAIELACLVCPGFQLKPPSRNLFNRRAAPGWLFWIELLKRDGRVKSDLEGCMFVLKVVQPELARPHNKSKLRQQALTLRNLISQERASWKRRPHLH